MKQQRPGIVSTAKAVALYVAGSNLPNAKQTWRLRYSCARRLDHHCLPCPSGLAERQCVGQIKQKNQKAASLLAALQLCRYAGCRCRLTIFPLERLHQILSSSRSLFNCSKSLAHSRCRFSLLKSVTRVPSPFKRMGLSRKLVFGMVFTLVCLACSLRQSMSCLALDPQKRMVLTRRALLQPR